MKVSSLQPQGCIAGWAHTPFGRLERHSVESLIIEVTRGALVHAGLGAGEVDAVFVGFYNGGLSSQDFVSSLPAQADERLRFKPATRVENACATGSAAIAQGLNSIAAGQADTVLVVGVEKMTDTPSARIADILLQAAYLPEERDTDSGFAGVFGRIAEQYFDRYGDQSEALARIAAKNHRNALDNPWAHMRKDLGLAFCRTESERNPRVAGPLKRSDCSLISDGAAALVLTVPERASGIDHAVTFRARRQVNDYLPLSRRNLLRFEGAERAWRLALDDAGTSLDDLDLVETHDCFTIAELLEYEAMGLTPRGKGAQAILEGWTERGGRLPVNVSGGLKAKGHPIGATGVSMHVMAAMQVTGTAGALQVPGTELAGVFNMGGVAVANYVSILEALH